MASTSANRVSEAHKTKVASLNSASEPAAKKAQKEKNKKVLQVASIMKPEEQAKFYAELKQSQIQIIDNMANSVTAELSNLHTIVDATKIAKDELEQIHQITAEANSLSALILSQEEQRENFEAEVAERKAAWDVEQREREVARKRDEDTYRYNLGVTRRKEDDDWDLKKQTRLRQFEEELSERNDALADAEKLVAASLAEVLELREKVSTADTRMDAEVKKHVAIATSSLKKDLEHQAALERLKYENTIALQTQQIQSLEQKGLEKDTQILNLTQKHLEATQRVQAIAERAVDAARPTYITQAASGHDNGNGKRAS